MNPRSAEGRETEEGKRGEEKKKKIEQKEAETEKTTGGLKRKRTVRTTIILSLAY